MQARDARAKLARSFLTPGPLGGTAREDHDTERFAHCEATARCLRLTRRRWSRPSGGSWHSSNQVLIPAVDVMGRYTGYEH
jgi:hypothetical protein